MSILWLIIKVSLLIILLIFLCLVFTLLVLVLAPIKYDCFYEKYEKEYYHFKIHLLKIIDAQFIYKDEKQDNKIKILGFNVYRQYTDGFKEKAEEKIEAKEQSIKHLSKEVVEDKTHRKITRHAIEKKWNTIKDLLADEGFKHFIKSTLKALKEVFQRIKPYKVFFTLIIGKEDPSDTGELVAQLTLLYPWYYRYGMIKGDFSRSGVWGDIYARGKFNLVTLIKIAVIFIMNKETREYINILLKRRKEN